MRILHISDSHYLEDFSLNHDFFREAFLKRSDTLHKLAQIQQEVGTVDLICHTGDVAHHGTLADYQKVKDTLTTLFPHTPILTTPGNHDATIPLQTVFFGKVTEDFFQVLELGDVSVLSFDNTHPTQKGGKLPQKTVEKLLYYLLSHPQRQVILMCHHHYLQEQPSLPCDYPPEFLQVLAQPNLKALLTGHVHVAHQGQWQGVPYFTAEALGAVARPSAQAKDHPGELDIFEVGGYHLYTLDQGTFSLEKVGSLPYGQWLDTVTPPQ